MKKRIWIAFFWCLLWCCTALAACDGADRALPVSVGSAVSATGETVESGMPAQEASRQGAQEALRQSSGAASGENAGEIFVHVCGAVKNPGIVRLPQGSRAFDALEAAGGFSREAAEDVVNLAGFVQDGEKLYFPTAEEAVQIRQEAEEKQSGLVNINTADVTALCTLPGIGESRAADIIAYREENGSFQDPEDIMQVPGIKEGAYAKIRDKITVR